MHGQRTARGCPKAAAVQLVQSARGPKGARPQQKDGNVLRPQALTQHKNKATGMAQTQKPVPVKAALALLGRKHGPLAAGQCWARAESRSGQPLPISALPLRPSSSRQAFRPSCATLPLFVRQPPAFGKAFTDLSDDPDDGRVFPASTSVLPQKALYLAIWSGGRALNARF